MLFGIKNLRKEIISGTLGIMVIMSQGGCAVHYYDEKTATEHLWGFGHMKMKLSVPQEGVKAAIKGTEIYGIGISKGKEDLFLMGGWSRQTEVEVIDENASVRIEWPTNNFYNIRVGTRPPFLKDIEGVQLTGKEQEE